MKIEQREWNNNSGWSDLINQSGVCNGSSGVVFLFGYGTYFNSTACYEDVKALYSDCIILGCSTAGNVLGATISDEAVVLSAVFFNKSTFKIAFEDFNHSDESYDVGVRLAKSLQGDGLCHIFVLSDGLNINGSKLSDGLNDGCDNKITISGGLAGDSINFEATYVVANEPAKTKRAVAIGFYGENINVDVGCYSDWDEFGAERVVTKSANNIVYEIDDKPALELYKSYLGIEAQELPGSGLKFPISIRYSSESDAIIRTLLAIDEKTHSLTFAGDVPQGVMCRLMKANISKLIDSAKKAANDAKPKQVVASLSIAISCVGRRLVLGQLVEDELDTIKESFGVENIITGYYSYGEIAPHCGLINCKLHNQTMTITTISEDA